VSISAIDNSWDACIRAIQTQEAIFSVAFSHKDGLIAVGEFRGVKIFEAATGQRRATLKTYDYVESLTFSPDDTILVTASDKGRVNAWDLQTGGLIGSWEGHNGYIRSVVFSPSGTLIATSSDDHTIRVWNTRTLDCRCVLKGHSNSVQTVCWSTAGSEVISGSSDTTVKVWSVSSKMCLKTFTIHTESVRSVTSSPDSSLIASASEDGVLQVFDAGTGEIFHTFSTNGSFIKLVQFLDRDQIIFSLSGTFIIRDLNTSSNVLTFRYDGWTSAISSNGTYLASSQGDVVKIWQTNSTNKHQDMAGHHTEEVTCVSFSKDGQLVASASEDTTVKIWNTTTGQCITTFRGPACTYTMCLFSPDSTLCASWGYDQEIRIWNVRSGDLISTLEQDGDYVFDFCFSPNGSQLVSRSRRKGQLQMVELWDVATGDRLASRAVTSRFGRSGISFDVDGTSIIMRGEKEAMQRWKLSSSATDNTSVLPSLPMAFVPIEDTTLTILSPLEDAPPTHQYHHDPKDSWILDKQERPVLWVPHDLRRMTHIHDTKVVFGSRHGVITIVDFSDLDPFSMF
jgi:WD40 repeat protein